MPVYVLLEDEEPEDECVCGDCAYFDADHGYCKLREYLVYEDDPACEHFSPFSADALE